MFRRSGDDHIDRWNGTRLLRAIRARSGHWIAFVARPLPSQAAFEVTVEAADHTDVAHQAVASTFSPGDQDFDRLCAEDPVIARYNAQYPGIRQIRQLDLFTGLIRCISAQQVNLRWAVTTRRRLAEAFGHRCTVDGEVVYALDPAVIAGADPISIRALQFTTAKSVSIVAVAQALAIGVVSTEILAALPDDEVIARLSSLRGIGRWSAEWILARTLGRPTVVAGDLGVRKAVGLAYLGEPAPSEQRVRELTRHWGWGGGTAQALLLHALGEGTLSGPATPRGASAGRSASHRNSGTDGGSTETTDQTDRHRAFVEPRERADAGRSARS